MKIQLDFDNKTITLEADCELKEFIPVIQRILPDWQKWTLKTFTNRNTSDNQIAFWGDSTNNDFSFKATPFTYTGGIVNIDVN